MTHDQLFVSVKLVKNSEIENLSRINILITRIIIVSS